MAPRRLTNCTLTQLLPVRCSLARAAYPVAPTSCAPMSKVRLLATDLNFSKITHILPRLTWVILPKTPRRTRAPGSSSSSTRSLTKTYTNNCQRLPTSTRTSLASRRIRDWSRKLCTRWPTELRAFLMIRASSTSSLRRGKLKNCAKRFS